MIYRILSHGAKPKIDPETNEEVGRIIRASLIIFNTDTKKSGVVELPEDLMDVLRYSNDIFVNEDGIHFPVSEIESENEKRYRLFKVSKL